ncbi:hypothetical protein HNP84_009723 [Thermocatellispora tengchongensis]|uniref:Uncharacterized protein n=1 Tax=Thermocatellispora tengchongensis TaxID=1073253 RepID=A0A840PKA6_9ACTN|nr:hypothetical protein [Thermocatellispora tengchongensis]MBB5139958.1 hypothetical protein [Thermocatellispora tengchongensis]
MSNHGSDRLRSAVPLALPGEEVRCPNCHATLAQCDDSGCGQRRKPGWRIAHLTGRPDEIPTPEDDRAEEDEAGDD